MDEEMQAGYLKQLSQDTDQHTATTFLLGIFCRK
jgi:hypothetical protein